MFTSLCLCVCLLLACDVTRGEEPADVDGDSNSATTLEELLRNKLNLVDSNPFPSDLPEEHFNPGREFTSRTKEDPILRPEASKASLQASVGDELGRRFKTVTMISSTHRQPVPPPEVFPASDQTPPQPVSSPPTLAPAVSPSRPLPRSHMDKLKWFLAHNQHRVQDFLQTVAPSPSLPELRAGVLRQLPRDPRGRPPVGVQLDMSPAKGGRVHILRMKNRLCHRHVLVPEGPKYDSLGRVYLGAHAGPQYPATRSPRLLLPRCCNCCKKSLLGCE